MAEVRQARGPRADALRSRALLVSAATEVFFRDGADGSLEEIARRAGVGSATLHRHFPSRWALLDAVFSDTVAALCEQGSATAQHLNPGAALFDWLHSVCAYFTKVRGLAAAMLHAREGDNSCEACHQMLHEAGQPLLRRAIEAGDVRADAGIDELLTLVSAAALAAEYSPTSSERLLTLALEGMGRR